MAGVVPPRVCVCVHVPAEHLPGLVPLPCVGLTPPGHLSSAAAAPIHPVHRCATIALLPRRCLLVPRLLHAQPARVLRAQGAANKLALAANPNLNISPHKIFMVYYDPEIDGLDFDGFSQVSVALPLVLPMLPGLQLFVCSAHHQQALPGPAARTHSTQPRQHKRRRSAAPSRHAQAQAPMRSPCCKSCVQRMAHAQRAFTCSCSKRGWEGAAKARALAVAWPAIPCPRLPTIAAPTEEPTLGPARAGLHHVGRKSVPCWPQKAVQHVLLYAHL